MKKNFPGFLMAFALILPLLFASCEKLHQNPSYSKENLLLGNWHDYSMADSLVVFERVAELGKDEYGFSIRGDHSFLERKNVGWCGTPPIAYGDYTGSWETRDSVLNISVPYWGGMMDYHWKIISVDEKFLKIVRQP